MHLRGPMNVSQLAVYTLSGTPLAKRAGSMSADTRRSRRHDIHPIANQSGYKTVDSNLSIHPVAQGGSDQIDHASDLQKRWYCSSTPTITTTIFVTDSVCGRPSSAIPSPSLPLPAPPVPPVPPSPPRPPAFTVTTTVHITDIICPQHPSTLPTNGPEKNPTSETKCLCMSTLKTQTSSVDETTTTLTDGMAASFVLFSRPGEQDSAVVSTASAVTTPVPLPLDNKTVGKEEASTWNRVAHYTSAAPAAATGFAFLANLGDPWKSGTFD